MKSSGGITVFALMLALGCNAILGIADHPLASSATAGSATAAGRSSAHAGGSVPGATSGTAGMHFGNVPGAGTSSDPSSNSVRNTYAGALSNEPIAGAAGVGTEAP